MIFIVDDDREFAECTAKMVRKFCQDRVEIFGNAIEAISGIDEEVPKLIFLDIPIINVIASKVVKYQCAPSTYGTPQKPLTKNTFKI